MEKTYLSITITEYGTKGIAPDVHYYRSQGQNVISTWDKLTEDEALDLMVELLDLGAAECYTINRYNSIIHTYQVSFWGIL